MVPIFILINQQLRTNKYSTIKIKEVIEDM